MAHLNTQTMRLIPVFILLFLFNNCTSRKEAPKDSAAATAVSVSEKNKELVRRVYYDMAAKQNYALLDSFCAENIFDHGAAQGQAQGLAGFKKAVTEFLGMFSAIEIISADIMAEGDFVASKEKWKLVRKSDNKEFSGDIMHWFRIKDGKITDEWSKGWESLGLW